ncbi:MAG TPA: hypothetical protein VNB06_22565 [Thermoanaerobaculia bacterium]|nr:hypothetical protein [Thermoanaerobaculia bacterium]
MRSNRRSRRDSILAVDLALALAAVLAIPGTVVAAQGPVPVSLTGHQRQHVGALGAQRHAHADLLSAQRHREREQPVQAERRQQERDRREGS